MFIFSFLWPSRPSSLPCCAHVLLEMIISCYLLHQDALVLQTQSNTRCRKLGQPLKSLTGCFLNSNVASLVSRKH